MTGRFQRRKGDNPTFLQSRHSLRRTSLAHQQTLHTLRNLGKLRVKRNSVFTAEKICFFVVLEKLSAVNCPICPPNGTLASSKTHSMKTFGRLTLIVTLLTVISCGSPESEKAASPGKKCQYSYNAGTTMLEWTAFKFTEKTAVKGTFSTINVSAGGVMDDAKELIESLSFSIQTSSVETQNPDRNAKIAKRFFGTIGTETISGEVKKLSRNGKAVIAITMNKVTKEVEGEYLLEDGYFTWNATIDVTDWNAIPGIDALNAICKDLHTGADGKSKLWSEVGLSFSTELEMECD